MLSRPTEDGASTRHYPQEFLAAERARALYLQSPVANLAVFAVSGVFFLLLRHRLDSGPLLVWMLLVWCSAAYRLWLWFRYQRAPSAQPPRAWLGRYAIASLLMGCAWSGFPLLVEELSDHVVVAMLFMLILGVTSAAVTVLSIHLPTFVLYISPPILSLVSVLSGHESTALTLTSFAIMGYWVMLVLFARNAGQLFESHVRLASENQELVGRLNSENERREELIRLRTVEIRQTNAALEREIKVRKQVEEALRRQERSLRHLAHHDALTGLPNRLLMSDRLAHAIRKAHRTGEGLAVIFIDFDHFKEINDSLGHSVGDQLLVAIAERLRHLLREEDTVARLGGDEFVVIAEQLQAALDASSIAEAIRSAFTEPLQVAERDLCVTTSIGISLYPADGSDAETLLRNADAAMYRAKAEGRNDYRFYAVDMTEKAQARIAMEGNLRRALERREFELLFQPILDLASGGIVGAEALIRWNHPSQGILLPDSFIPVAESTGQIDRIGAWVLHEVCARLSQWRDLGIGDTRVAVNLSGRQLLHGDLVGTMRNCIRQSGVDPRLIELEITEGYLIQRPEVCRTTLDKLRAMGVQIAIDDFGTGYSSLSYLKQFPISKIKIDRSFVRDIRLDPNDQAIVTAIIALGRSLGLGLVAEGVESEEQASFLAALGCDEVQGYLYSKPLSAAAFVHYWQSAHGAAPNPEPA